MLLSLSRIEITRAFRLSYGNRTSSALKSPRFCEFTAALARLRPQLLMACESPITTCGQLKERIAVSACANQILTSTAIRGGKEMPRGDKDKYTDKEKRQARHIEE